MPSPSSSKAACTLSVALLIALQLCCCTASAVGHQEQAAGVHKPRTSQQQRAARRLVQYTGAVVAGSGARTAGTYSSTAVPGYRDTAFAANPAVGLVNDAMATGQAPSDIASVRGRAWVRGKIMGQRIDAEGVANANIGNNNYGGVTAVGDAYGQFETSGRYGYAAGQGQARAAAATTLESANNGYTVMNGAAAAQASGQVYGALPTGQAFYARGSASAQAEGTIMYAT